MHRSFTTFFLLLATMLAHADGSNMDSDRVKAVLRDMEKTSTWYHDDLAGEYAGFGYYARKQYAEALHNFELGAYYADKPSQISIGLMYLKGEGVEADPVTALAWLDLAAERDYPTYVMTRDRIRATLTAEQVSRATELRRKLAMTYADTVAKPRLAAELSDGFRQQTGSRAGFDTGVGILPVEAIDPHHRAAPSPLDVRTVCPGGFWAAECWHPDLYFAMRDRQLNATVAVGPVEQQK